MGLSRRRFLAVTAAAVCVGCTDTGSADDADNPGVPVAGRIPAGTNDEVRDAITARGGAMYVVEARAWIVPDEDGAFLALSQRCPHLGCRVPWCETSKRFECPCHSAVFNRLGEAVEGPARRGMDRHPVRIDDGQVVVDTGETIEGPPVGELTVDGEPAGPVCDAPP